MIVLGNHLWQSTLFAIAAGLLAVAFRKNGAHIRYWLWFSASLKFLVPFSLLISIGAYVPSTLGVRPVMTSPVTPRVSSVLAKAVEPLPTLPVATVPAQQVDDWTVPLAAAWASGSIAIVIIRLRHWRGIRRAVRASTPLDITAPVEVRSTADLLEPGVVGFFHPVLVVPVDIGERLSRNELEAVLAHEICHVRRRDNLLATVHMAVELLFWFYPLIWWIGARLIEERERTCDEHVLRLGGEPRVYAEAILNVCKLYVESPLVCISGVTGANLKRRIEAIMKNQSTPKLNLAGRSALLLAATLCALLPIAVGIFDMRSVRGQTTPAAPRFDVASVKRCQSESGRMRAAEYRSSGGDLNTGCMPLVDAAHLGLLQRAYVRFADPSRGWPNIVPIEGGPDWVRSDLYSITAKTSRTSAQQVIEGAMLRALLEERFKLQIRPETREVPVYSLAIAGGTSSLKSFEDGSCTAMPSTVPPPALPAGQRYCNVRVGVRPPAIDAEGVTLGQFSQLLTTVLDRPVIDTTGMGGKFTIHVEFAVDQSTPRFLPGGELGRFATQSRAGVPPILAAVQQLGLKLQPGNGPREFLVIDHIERPVEN